MIIAVIICLRGFVVLFICADIYGHGGSHLKVVAVFTDVLNRISYSKLYLCCSYSVLM